MSMNTIQCRLVDSPSRLSALQTVFEARLGHGTEDPSAVESLPALQTELERTDLQPSAAALFRGSVERSEDGTVLDLRLEATGAGGYETWLRWRGFLESLELEAVALVYQQTGAGVFEVTLLREGRLRTYATQQGGAVDSEVVEALGGRDPFDRLWALESSGRLSNPALPDVGRVCTGVLVALGYLDEESDVHARARREQTPYGVLATVFPEHASELPSAAAEASHLLDLLEDHVRVVPGWTLTDASIDVTPCPGGSEDYPAHDVVIRFSSLGQEFEWSFRHEPFPFDREIYERIHAFVEKHFAGRLLPLGSGCIYVDPAWHTPVLRALAPPRRLSEIIRNDDVNAFTALYDRIGHVAMELALTEPGGGGSAPQDLLTAGPEGAVARAWEDFG